MTPTLIVLAFLALGVGIVAFATRRPKGVSDAPRHEQDTAWGEPPTQTEAQDDPFAHAPTREAIDTPAPQPERLP